MILEIKISSLHKIFCSIEGQRDPLPQVQPNRRPHGAVPQGGGDLAPCSSQVPSAAPPLLLPPSEELSMPRALPAPLPRGAPGRPQHRPPANRPGEQELVGRGRVAEVTERENAFPAQGSARGRHRLSSPRGRPGGRRAGP